MSSADLHQSAFAAQLAVFGETVTHEDGAEVDVVLDVVRTEDEEDGGGETVKTIGSLSWWGADLTGVQIEDLFTREDGSVWTVRSTPLTEDGVTMADVESRARRRVGRH